MIDIGTLNEKIAAFRRLTIKNSVSPEMVGELLQQITDILSTAGTQANLDLLNQWRTAMLAAQPYIHALTQNGSDRNDFYINATVTNPVTAATQVKTNLLKIPQATTEHSGVMRAQQVTDLNQARNNINSVILPTLTRIENEIAALNGTSTDVVAISGKAQIAVEIVNGTMQVYGASKLLEAGYVPYLFRHTRRRNRDRMTDGIHQDKKYGAETNGWHLYGSRHTIKINGTNAYFSQNDAVHKHMPTTRWTLDCSALIHIHIRQDGQRSIPWGRSMIRLYDSRARQERMLRLRFAIGFAKPLDPCRKKLNVLNLVSNLAEFSVVYTPVTQEFHLSR
ncbi:MAG: hypothetical protein ACI30O_02225 [Muribaculaceae bacterium]